MPNDIIVELENVVAVVESDYSKLENKPQVNSISLDGNKTSIDLGLASQQSIDEITTQLNSIVDSSLSVSGKAADALITGTTLNAKVDKVEGKDLSTNDYTNDDKTKLSGIEASAEENAIETVKLNGTALIPDENKAVNIEPTISDVSGLSGELSYLTRTRNAAYLVDQNVGPAYNGATVSADKLTLTIPAGSTGKNTYIGQQMQKHIGAILGRKFVETITFTSEGLTSEHARTYFTLDPQVLFNNSGVTVTNSDIDIVNGVAHLYFTVASDASCTYVSPCLKVTSNTTFQNNIVINITSYSIEYRFDDMSDILAFYNPFRGMKMACMGHSMVDMSRWQNTTVSDLDLSGYENEAVSGGTLISNYQHVSNIDIASDIVVIWYDTNDWKNSVALGAIDDALPDGTLAASSFYAALKYVCEWLGTNIPKARVVLVASPKRFDEQFVTTNSKGYQLNSNSNSLEDFADAIRAVADLYSYKFCDLFHRSGINTNNYATYLNNDKLHPSYYGGGIIGHIIANAIKEAD